ncbi:hypothetical protein DPMN_089492 [Dreissena polymorpha]|uniref:Uncharacterized protein n=1 Tax=Dreissena polymorpha TaxID=45954 RepID=A0A9D4KW28_DREPO|nr:hypothetical protein DPMN_089492 [Dreissena polymorpha]
MALRIALMAFVATPRHSLEEDAMVLPLALRHEQQILHYLVAAQTRWVKKPMNAHVGSGTFIKIRNLKHEQMVQLSLICNGPNSQDARGV